MAELLREIGIDLDDRHEAAGQNHPGDLVRRLLNAWRTEVNAPEILPHDTNLVEVVRENLKAQTETLDALFEGVEEEEREKQHFTWTLYQMEAERVRYSLARYLRVRLLKIEDTLDFVLSNVDLLDRLSFAEKQFAASLNELNNNHFEDHLTGKLPESMHEMVAKSDDRVRHSRPAMNEFVFIMALEDLDTVSMDDNNPDLTLRKRGCGSGLCSVPYRSFASADPSPTPLFSLASRADELWVARYSQVHREVVAGNILLL